MEVAALQSHLLTQRLANTPSSALTRGQQLEKASGQDDEVRKQFDTFVGETFFGQMLGSMRKTVGKPAYFHGGQAEEVFRGQLDQILAGELSKASAHELTGPMFDLFMMHRS